MLGDYGNDPGLLRWLEAARLDAGALLKAMAFGRGRGIAVVDLQGTIRAARGPAADALGLAAHRSITELLPEAAEALERARAGEAPGAPLRVVGSTAIHLLRLFPAWSDAAVAGVLVLIEDGTEWDDLLRRARNGEGHAREQDAIINSVSDGIWVCDAGGNVLRVNPASARLNGIAPAAVVGRNMRDLLREGLFDRSATLEVIRTGRPVQMLQSRLGRKLVLNGTPVCDEQGRLIRVVVSERDVTEIEALQHDLEEQAAMRDRLRGELLEQQIASVEARRVVAASPSMQRALQVAIKVAAADSTVLILGESGAGKGLFADLIHRNSPRAGHPVVKVNCGAIPESLIEAELFGYEKGAFTGAQARGKAGYFEAAEGGTLFLDEVAELPLASQVKLLRFLEDRRITRVGATATREIDVRILAATHRDLEEMVDRGQFRLDLYYRLNVIPLLVPPLRERRDCLLPLLRHYMDLFAAKLGVRRRLSREATDLLLAYPWPGNVRELMNLCERLVVMSDSEVVDRDDLPGSVVSAVQERAGALVDELPLQEALERTERALLLRARRRYGNQQAMAEALKVNQSTIARKLKRHRIA